MYAPGSGDAIMQGVDGLHGLRGAGGQAKQAIDTANKMFRTSDKGARDKLVVQFGDQLDNVKQKANKSKALLRDAQTRPAYTMN